MCRDATVSTQFIHRYILKQIAKFRNLFRHFPSAFLNKFYWDFIRFLSFLYICLLFSLCDQVLFFLHFKLIEYSYTRRDTYDTISKKGYLGGR